MRGRISHRCPLHHFESIECLINSHHVFHQRRRGPTMAIPDINKRLKIIAALRAEWTALQFDCGDWAQRKRHLSQVDDYIVFPLHAAIISF